MRSLRISGQPVNRFELAGTHQTLTEPRWSHERPGRRGDIRARTTLSSMVPVSEKLLAFARSHMACMKEVTKLNARVNAHNEDYQAAKRQGQDESIPKTVITFNTDGLSRKGAELNKEVNDFRKRCQPYQTFEAATPFVDAMREEAGFAPRPRPGAA